jgi:threonine/homoserine/homoserine lactone efflux protein
MIFFTTGSIWCLVLIYKATWATGRLRCRDSLGWIIKKATGALFVGLSIKLTISGAQ